MKVTRREVGRLDAPERTPQGFLKAPAHLTRAGVFVYYNADGSERREWRPLKEVMDAGSLATLISSPVTDRHPPEMVTLDNRGKYDRGNVGENILRDGGKVAASLYVKDGKLISAVERGDRREVSCGYTCDVAMTPGVVPAGEPDEGQKYDAVQSGIVYNHVAVVPQGRAGSARIHLDAAGDAVFPHFDNEDKHMKIEVIDGVEYTVGTDAHTAAVKRRADAEKARKDAADALQAKADKAEADLAEAKKRIDGLPAELEKKAKERADLLGHAREILGEEYVVEGKTDAVIKLDIAKHANPSLKFDGKSEAYVEPLFEAAVASRKSGERNDGIDDLRRMRADAGAQDSISDDEFPNPHLARLDMVDRLRNPNKADDSAAAQE